MDVRDTKLLLIIRGGKAAMKWPHKIDRVTLKSQAAGKFVGLDFHCRVISALPHVCVSLECLENFVHSFMATALGKDGLLASSGLDLGSLIS